MGSEDDTTAVEGPRPQPALKGLPEIDPRNYELGDEIAEGGMGRIRAARDLRLGRDVAIKEVKESRGHHAMRFEREALVTARLQHPSIVAVYEAGRWPSGEPFLAMKLVRGQPLKKVIERAPDFDGRLALLPHAIAVADAMAYAHEHRVIHRDLKPSNVLVGDFGETVVIDWGIAKDLGAAEEDTPGPARTSDADLTRDGTVIGTPNYMPPEQARGEAVDERADVYAIGAMLYHLLAGEPPYRGTDATRVLTDVTTKPPTPLVERERRVPPDLLAIVERAMAREPAQRYRTARELAEDLRRFQTGQLVASHQYSRRELIVRFVRRYRGMLAVAAAATLVLLGVGGFSFYRILAERDASRAAERRADDERKRAEQEKAIAIGERDNGLIAHAQSLVTREPDAALRKLQQLSNGTKHLAEAHMIASDARVRGIPRTIDAHRGGIVALVASLDGKTVATAGADRVVSVWDAATGARRNIGKHALPIYDIALSPDGMHIATASNDRTARVWRIDGTGDPDVLVHGSPVVGVAFSPDGELLASLSAEAVRVWQVSDREVIAQAPHTATSVAFTTSALIYQSGEDLYRLDLAGGAGAPRLIARVSAWTLAADRTQIATASKAGLVQLWNTSTWQATVLGQKEDVSSLALSRDNQQLALAHGGMSIWRIGGKPMQRDLSVTISNAIRAISFSADDRSILVRSGLVSVTHVDTANAVKLPTGDDVSAAVFAGDHVYAARRGALVSWRWRLPTRFIARVDINAQVHYTPDGRLVVADEKFIRIGDRTLAVPGSGSNFAFDAKYQRAAFVGDDRQVQVIDLDTGDIRNYGGEVSGEMFFRRVVALDRTGRWLASEMASPGSSRMRIVDLTTGKDQAFEISLFNAHHFAFSDDSTQLILHSIDGQQVIDVVSGARQTVEVPAGPTVVYQQDDTNVVVADVAARQFWSVTSARPVHEVGLSPDRSLFAFSDMDGVVTIYRISDRKRLASFEATGVQVGSIVFSADNTTVVTGSAVITIYSLVTGLKREIDDGAGARTLAISPDGKRIAVAGDDAAREWLDDLPRDEAGLRAWIESALK